MKIHFSYKIYRLLRFFKISEWKSFEVEYKVQKFEEWLNREKLTILCVSLDFDKMKDGKYHKITVSMDDIKFHHVDGIWQKNYFWSAQAKVET